MLLLTFSWKNLILYLVSDRQSPEIRLPLYREFPSTEKIPQFKDPPT